MSEFTIGSQWESRRHGRSVIVDTDVLRNDMGVFKVYRVWNKSTDVTSNHFDDGTHEHHKEYDLIKLWYGKRKGFVYFHVNKDGKTFISDDKATICSATNPVIAIRRIEWTEGEFDE